jgi:hypothetical protein
VCRGSRRFARADDDDLSGAEAAKGDGGVCGRAAPTTRTSITVKLDRWRASGQCRPRQAEHGGRAGEA